jgi:hypothetical protein
MQSEQDRKRARWLIEQLERGEFFHQKLHEYGLLEVAYTIENIRGDTLEWDTAILGITPIAWNKVIHRLPPIRVFAHPFILENVPRSVGYYRGLSMVSLKSMNNIGLSINAFEDGTNKHKLSSDKALKVARRLNELICRFIEEDDDIDTRELDMWRGLSAGASIDGSWRNKKGDIAEDLVKGLFKQRLHEMRLVLAQTEEKGGHMNFTLTDNRVVEMTSEPDIAIYENGIIQQAIEIKGGIDQAGVLERVGAAIKSLSRAKTDNPKAKTLLFMYQISMTPQAIKDLEDHRADIDAWYTIENFLNKKTVREAIFRSLSL